MSRIVTLKGADRIRKRPHVVFGSDGLDGAVAAVRMLMDLFITQAMNGHCSHLSVTVFEDGALGVRSADRGMVFDETVVDGKPLWQHLFCELYLAPRHPAYLDSAVDGEAYPHDLYGDTDESANPYYQDDGFDLCCVQYVSQYMLAESVREGICKTVRFENGCAVGELQQSPTDREDGTYIHFRLAPEVFRESVIPPHILAEILRETAVCVKGLTCELTDESTGKTATFRFEQGLVDYAANVVRGREVTPFYVSEREATGKDRYDRQEYTAKVRAVIGFSSTAATTECYHNARKTKGGTHLEAIRKKVRRWIEMRFGTYVEDGQSSFEKLSDHMVLMVETTCPKHAVEWGDATQTSIANAMIADIASDLINSNFDYFLKQHHEAILRLLHPIV